MESIKREFKELLRDYDAIEDEEMVEFALETFKLGCKYGEEKTYKKMERSGFGRREEEEEFEDLFEDDEEEMGDIFRSSWRSGGFGRRSGGGSGGSGGSSGGSGGSSGGSYGNRRGRGRRGRR